MGRRALRFAGPALIVLGPALVLHDFWLGTRLPSQQVDLLPFWLPRWCFLGKAVAAGHIPAWLPHQFGGVPFASDPQSGWLYLPAMVLFGALSCSRALGAVILLNPILAGLGLYLFFRNEGVDRPAATVGGVTLALGMSGSVVVLSMPFAGAIAWTALALAGASGYLHAISPVARVGWVALSGLAIMQVAGAHLTNGLMMAALLLVLYVAARSVVDVRAGRRAGPATATGALALFAPLPFLAAAVLVPRLALLPRTTIGRGYGDLARLTAQLSGAPFRSPFVTRGASVWWGTSFARGPGGYVGAVAILLVGVALASRRWRLPAAAFAMAGLIGWLLNLDIVIRQRGVQRAAIGSNLGELWLRDPSRFRYLLIVAFAGLAGYGTQAWMDMPVAGGRDALMRRALWFMPPLVVFVAAPLAAGSPFGPYVPLMIGLAAAVPVLLLAARGSAAFRLAVPVVAGVELLVVGLVGVARAPAKIAPASTISTDPFDHSFPKLRRPAIDPAAYLTPGPIGQALAQDRSSLGRYVTFDPERALLQVAGARPPSLVVEPAAYEDGQSILLGVDEIQGYSPVQLDRYWRLVRRVDRISLFYSAATFRFVTPEILKLFGVRWVIASGPPPAGMTEIAREGSEVLYRVPDPAPRASLVFSWGRESAPEALDMVLTPGFDSDRVAVVEEDVPGGSALHGAPTPDGRASYEELTPEHVVVKADAPAPGLVVVRNAFDKGWHATVDGRDVRLLRADFMMQAVPVPAGPHTVELTYREPAIGLGLAISAASWLAFAGLALLLAARARRRT